MSKSEMILHFVNEAKALKGRGFHALEIIAAMDCAKAVLISATITVVAPPTIIPANVNPPRNGGL